jgi:hypothetical protein
VKGSRALSFPQQHWFIDSGFVFGEHAIAVAKRFGRWELISSEEACHQVKGLNTGGLASIQVRPSPTRLMPPL